MENYRFSDNTIVHSIGFNPWKIESILTNGILSKSEASKNNVWYARNYFGYNFDDYAFVVQGGLGIVWLYIYQMTDENRFTR